MGITDPAEKDKLAALTREAKVKDLKRTELHKIRWSWLTPEEERELKGLGRGLERQAAIDPLTRASQALGKWAVPLTAGQAIQGRATREVMEREAREPARATRQDFEAVDYAIKHIFYTASVVTEDELLTEAMKWGCGLADSGRTSHLAAAGRRVSRPGIAGVHHGDRGQGGRGKNHHSPGSGSRHRGQRGGLVR
jgi:hypothetical protein